MILSRASSRGGKAGRGLEADEMLKEYYTLGGWVDGKRTKTKLRELGRTRAANEVGV